MAKINFHSAFNNKGFALFTKKQPSFIDVKKGKKLSTILVRKKILPMPKPKPVQQCEGGRLIVRKPCACNN